VKLVICKTREQHRIMLFNCTLKALCFNIDITNKLVWLTLLKLSWQNKQLNNGIATTPLIKSNELSEQFHCEVYLKLEQLQYTGSFKVRGVFNSLLNLNETERKKG
jgi:threonine dehydratase